MKAEILQPEGEKRWDDFVNNHPLASIHQTSLWGRFQAKIPSRGKCWIIALSESAHGKNAPGKIIGGTVLIRHSLPKGYCWFYAPRGPLLDYENEAVAVEQMKMLLQEIEKIAKEENAIFLRIDPLLEEPESALRPFPGFKTTPYGFQPQHTIVLDLKKSEEELLKEMKPKGRYNIKIAEKKGVQIREVNDPSSKNFDHDLDAFYDLILQTTSRDNFSGHNKDFYKNFLETLAPNMAKLYLAEYNGKVIAGILMTYFAKTATYYYGASGNEDRNVMAPYLLQWHAIKEAKKNGFEIYDFFGIAPTELGVFQHAEGLCKSIVNKAAGKSRPQCTGMYMRIEIFRQRCLRYFCRDLAHPWQGVTDFKRKFGGHNLSFAPAREYSFKKLLYFLYTLYKKIKK